MQRLIGMVTGGGSSSQVTNERKTSSNSNGCTTPTESAQTGVKVAGKKGKAKKEINKRLEDAFKSDDMDFMDDKQPSQS